MAKSKRNVLMPAGIRNKLLAAVSMLMVSSVMLVSTTYAWFTLSTAPEVKNISTTVAGNGSLEIALMPSNGQLGSIRTGYASNKNGGTKLPTDTNITWGNIINLSEGYGLEQVNLNPARLNTVSSGDADTVSTTAPLGIATYGYDGRIYELQNNTALRTYAGGSFSGTGYGVRVIGEESSVSVSGNNVLGDTYGYVVDLAFRLNATENGTKGNLLLQTKAAQRIYDDSTNEETQGGGSYMSFDAGSTGLDVTKLMSAVRVTFVKNYGLNTEDTDLKPEILGTAKLDVTNIKTGASTKSAELYLYEGTTMLNGTKDDQIENNEPILIESMDKNTAYQVSAIVWLEGDSLTNASVAAVSSTMAKATLNLQFSTDIELNPAENNVLQQGVID